MSADAIESLMCRIALLVAIFGLGFAIDPGLSAVMTAIPSAPVPPVPAPAASPAVSLPIGARKPTIAYIKQGTEITLRLARQITTERRALNVGDLFDLETAAPVMLGSLIVVPEGSKALGEVTYVDYKGGWGHNGRLICRLLYLMVGDRRIAISGTLDNKGKGGAWAMIGLYPVAWLIALGPISGFVSTGKSARIPAGATVKGVIAEDIAVDITGNEKAAMSVVPVAVAQSAASASQPAASASAVPPSAPPSIAQSATSAALAH